MEGQDGSVWQVEEREGVGRVLVASRDVRPGQVVLVDQAVVTGPASRAPVVCLECLASRPAARCQHCGWPVGNILS